MSFEVATKRILSDDKFLGHFPCFLGTLCSKARKLKSFLEKFVRPNYSKYPSYKSIQFCLLHRLSQRGLNRWSNNSEQKIGFLSKVKI